MSLQVDIEKLSISDLERITGQAYRTVVKRLKDSGMKPVLETDNGIFYDGRKALPALYLGAKKNSDKKTLEAQRVLESEAKTKKVEIEIEEKLGNLIPLEVVESSWVDMTVKFKDKIESVPSKLATRLFGLEVDEINQILTDEIREALDELAISDDAKPSGKRCSKTKK